MERRSVVAVDYPYCFQFNYLIINIKIFIEYLFLIQLCGKIRGKYDHLFGLSSSNFGIQLPPLPTQNLQSQKLHSNLFISLNLF